ncbi:MAG: hypothetical protein HOP33_15250 [Verrucomicrobia bacterium]|nr:hypothetical protein [Verrucomicrobiota bacterium]
MKKSSALRNSVLALATIVAMLCAPTLTRAALVAAWGDNTYGQTRLPVGVSSIKAIAGGDYHSLALRSDGTVVTWGLNNQGQIDYPSGLANVKAIAAGGNHCLALKVNGSVIAWGSNFYGLTDVPGNLSRVAAIACGALHNLALSADGTVVAWGYNLNGETNVPAGVSGAIAIAAGANHNLALKADGSVVAWGNNSYGQTNVPSDLSDVVAIATHGNFNLALKANGTVTAWGENLQNQTNVPAGLSNITAIAAGFYHAMALTTDGTVVTWGGNSYGQSAVPTGLSNVTAIAASGYHSLALVPDGPPQILLNPESQSVPYTSTVIFSALGTGGGSLSYRWFFNGSPINLSNVRVSGATTPTLTISTLQFSDIGTYAAVVSNPFGSVISKGATLNVISPPFIALQPVGSTVRAGSSMSIQAVASGTPPLLYQWNFNGTNIPGATNTYLSLLNVQPSDSGDYYMMVANTYGSTQTVSATLTVTDSPPYILQQPYVPLPGQRTATSTVAPIGGGVTINFTARGSLPLSYQWRFNGVDIPNATNTTLTMTNLQYNQAGYYNVEVNNSFGTTNSAKFFLNVSQVLIAGTPFASNINTPLGLSNVIAVAAGGSHVMALRSDGTVRTWLANGNFIFEQGYAVTNIPGSVTNIIAIAAGLNHCLALRSNGTVVAWGSAGTHTNVPTTLSNVVSIAAATSRSYAVKADGTITGWGASATIPTGLTNVVAVVAGSSQNLALKRDGTVTAWGNGSLASVPPGISNVIAIAAGSIQNRALRQDGTVVAWSSSSGFITETESVGIRQSIPLSNVIAIAVGSSVSMTLKQDGTIRSSELEKIGLTVSNNISAIAAGGVQSGFGVMVFGGGSPNITLHPYSQIVLRSNTVRLHSRAAGVQPMRYQWLLDNLPLPGATNSSLILSNFLGKDTGAYRMIASNALGTVASQIARISIPFNTNLAAALNTNNWFWGSIERTPAWFAQNGETHDGEVAAQSGVIANNQQSDLQTTITGPGTLRFWWKVSSEEGFDFLHFYLDKTATPLVSISGEADWEQKTFAIPTGVHTLRWTYVKDVSVSAGRDAGWLDEVFFTPNPPVITRQPEPNLSLPAGASAGYKLEVSGVGPFSYQWFKDGNSLLGATQTFLNVPGVNRRSSGTYRVQASNAGGSVMSSNAVLKVIVRQRMGSIHRATDGSLEITSRDADGGELIPSDLPLFEAQASTNLIHWQTLPDVLSVTNGSLLLRDVDANHWPQRFYRVVER